MKKRNKIEEKYKWDLSGYYNSQADFESDFSFVKQNYSKLKDYENKLNEKSSIYDFLKLDEEISRKLEKLYVYASLKAKEDMTNSACQKTLKDIEKLSVDVSEVCSFSAPELSELSDEFLMELSQDAKFADFDLFFKDIIKNKKHMLSKKEERILALTGEFSGEFGDIFDMFDTADIQFEDIFDSNGKKYELNNSSYYQYIQSNDRTLRKNAMKTLNKKYGELKSTLSANYMGNVKSDYFYAKVRGFSSALESSLYSEDVNKDVYNTLIKSVNKNLQSFHRFFDLKRKLLGNEKFAIYDIHAPTSSAQFNYEFEKAFELVCQALSVLGEDYIDVLNLAKNKQWIDVYANQGKDTGAFSWGAYDANPVVLLNYENTTSCVFTLAHELGHMMHTYYSNKSQCYQKAGYEIFVAEVASTVNEMLLALHLLNNSKSDKDKLFYIDYILKMFNSTVFRQTMFAEFEQEAHSRYEKSEDTTTRALCDLYYNLNKTYFGDKVELVDEIQYEWLRIPHFYTSFYVYKYATGLISAFYIANKIFSGDKQAIANYRKFLTLGATMPPVDLLKVAGVNLSETSTFDYVFSQLEKLLENYEQTINSISKNCVQ